MLEKKLDAKITAQCVSKDAVDNKAALDACDFTEAELQQFMEKFTMRSVTTLEQRLSDPVCQPVSFKPTVRQRIDPKTGKSAPVMISACPQRLRLVTKESFTCPSKGCGEFVCKPQRPAKNTQYERRAMACQLVPRLTLREIPSFKTGKPTPVFFRVQNRLKQDLQVIVEVEADEFTNTNLEVKDGRVVIVLKEYDSKVVQLNMVTEQTDGDVFATLLVTLISASNPPIPLGNTKKPTIQFRLDCTLGKVGGPQVSKSAYLKSLPGRKQATPESSPSPGPTGQMMAPPS